MKRESIKYYFNVIGIGDNMNRDKVVDEFLAVYGGEVVKTKKRGKTLEILSRVYEILGEVEGVGLLEDFQPRIDWAFETAKPL